MNNTVYENKKNDVNIIYPELLAPAGNKESLIGAFNAGADAVYLAGERFGARAYAANFSKEELLEAIDYAHLFHKKIYLTVNTLIKQSELLEMVDYLRPYYEAGLDGIIIQDLGVFALIQIFFPELEIHISTQMTITSSYGAIFMKELGASRIVPARELTLEEIKIIKRKCNIEIETFIHGAMCYSYSGACLFSSMLGGRSGNRGRCAQPCRLSYQVICPENKNISGSKETFCISMKDMCTIDMVPQMADAGIDSFKIEGRMKKPEYAAGVSAIYRKYLDFYIKGNGTGSVTKSDRKYLEQLYTRSMQHTGYYNHHNGKDMITMETPSYNGVDDVLLQEIRARYLSSTMKRTAQLFVRIKPGEAISYSLNCGMITLEGLGEIVQQAQSRPLLKEDVMKQLNKTGNTNIVFDQIELDLSPDSFISLKAINEMRRHAVHSLEEELLRHKKRNVTDVLLQTKYDEIFSDKSKEKIDNKNKSDLSNLHPKTAITVSTTEQIKRVLKFQSIHKVYVPADLILNNENQSAAYYNPIWEELKKWKGEIYIILPQIIRDLSFGMDGSDYNDKMLLLLKQEMVRGYIVKNIDGLGFLFQNQLLGAGNNKEIIADAGIYQFNGLSSHILKSFVDIFTIPYELNLAELLNKGVFNMEIPIYGRIPMMVSANCIRKTTSGCDMGRRQDYYDFSNKENQLYLRDRYQTKFPVVCDCTHCINMIYNSVPLSLHSYLERLKKEKPHTFRIDLTVETGEESEAVLRYLTELIDGEKSLGEPPYKNYTKGHFARGVE